MVSRIVGGHADGTLAVRDRVADQIPGMSGFDAMQRLRESPETRDIPVIGLSAGALLKDTTRAKDAGFYRYLTKPVKVAEFTKVLEDLLVRSAQ